MRRPLRALAAAALCHSLSIHWDGLAIAFVQHTHKHWALLPEDTSFMMSAAKTEYSTGQLDNALALWNVAARVQQMAWEPGCGPERPGLLLTQLLVARARSELLTISQARPLPLLLLQTCRAHEPVLSHMRFDHAQLQI